MADQDDQKDQTTSDQGDGATGTVSNEDAQALVDSGEAEPGPAADEPAKDDK